MLSLASTITEETLFLRLSESMYRLCGVAALVIIILISRSFLIQIILGKILPCSDQNVDVKRPIFEFKKECKLTLHSKGLFFSHADFSSSYYSHRY